MTIDELFLRDEKRIKKLYDTELLANLLLLNYQFSNNKYHNATASDVLTNLHKVKYSKKDLEQIKNNAIALLEIKYNIKVNEEWHTKVYVGNSKKYIVITLKYRKEIYKSIMKYIDTNYPISKPCATNNQSIYVYPDYD